MGFKIGDKVEIIGNNYGTGNKIGDIGTIGATDTYGLRTTFRVDVIGGPRAFIWHPKSEIKLLKLEENMKEFKIRTYGSVELSKAIQKKLFELGFSWYGEKTIQYTDMGFLFLHSNQPIGGDNRKSYFVNSDLPEITIDELMKMEPEKQMTLKLDSLEHTIELTKNGAKIGCQNMTKDDLLKAADEIQKFYKE